MDLWAAEAQTQLWPYHLWLCVHELLCEFCGASLVSCSQTAFFFYTAARIQYKRKKVIWLCETISVIDFKNWTSRIYWTIITYNNNILLYFEVAVKSIKQQNFVIKKTSRYHIFLQGNKLYRLLYLHQYYTKWRDAVFLTTHTHN